jgi:chromosome segregation ATPase
MIATLLLAGLASQAVSVSPVQKVVELLDDCAGKVKADLAAEETQMEQYSAFCDEELTTKGYNIKTATRSITDLSATIEDCKAQIADLDDEIVTGGSELAAKDAELANATAVRAEEQTTFKATESELVTTVDQLSRAILELKKSMAFLQVKGKHTPQEVRRLKVVTTALSKIVDAAWVTEGSKKRVAQFLQSTQKEDDDLDLSQPQAKTVAYESHSGGIVEAVVDMKSKAEETLTEARRGETKAQHAYSMMKQSLENGIKILMEKKAAATTGKATATEQMGKASGELVETKKAKAADEAYSATLKGECETAATMWAERQKSAADEMGAIQKAKEILTSGVRVFVQVKASKGKGFIDDHSVVDDDDDKESRKRASIVQKLKDIAHKSHSFAMMEMATAAGSDPFGKVRGLIEDMIAKLVEEANQEATQKAFCDEEIGKSKESQAEKTATLDKLQSRIDTASATKAELEQSIKELESEIAGIDSAQAEATKIRNDEHAAYLKGSKDFKDAAAATEKAMVVLKEYYEGALIQVSVKGHTQQPEFGGAKSDTAHSIISILEMAAEDFTRTYTEIETDEAQKVKAFKTLSDENAVSKAEKAAEAKASASEVKSLSVALENTGQDHSMVSKELDAVLSYLDKLKPQCETKAMSYAEKKAKREAEIEGLKEALEILDGSAVLLQINKH